MQIPDSSSGAAPESQVTADGTPIIPGVSSEAQRQEALRGSESGMTVNADLVRAQAQRQAESVRQLDPELIKLLKKIEEIHAEIRKVWAKILSGCGGPRAKKRLLERLKVLEKILMFLCMKTSSSYTPSLAQDQGVGGDVVGAPPVSTVASGEGTIPTALPSTSTSTNVS